MKLNGTFISGLAFVSVLAVTGMWIDGPRAAYASGITSAVLSTNSHQRQIKHVVYIIMDNVHQSDIQQMPHVVDFLRQGTLFVNDHTVLNSHTQDGMLSDMTGKYPDQTGVIDQGFFENGAFSSFAYWTAVDPDGKPHVTTAPNWAVFNQHGWSVGAVGAPDMELESDKEVAPSIMNPNDMKARDYLGIALHNTDGSTTFGSPNIPYLFNAPSWLSPAQPLGGFPGWGDATDLNWSLEATYEMQTHGVPVTFTYLHDAHEVNGKEALPGTYQATLSSYDSAISLFLAKMNLAGLNPGNTLFIMTTDEGDHLMPNGELTTNLKSWLANNSLNTLDADNLNIYGDSGALVYLQDQTLLPKTLASLTAVPGWNYVADATELWALHMDVAAAPDRNPSFVLFSKPDVYYGTNGSAGWSYNADYYWNHGTISPDILDIWLGMVGPGVKADVTSNQWIDHADTVPTIYTLLGYALFDNSLAGVPAVSGLNLPGRDESANNDILMAESVYKQLNAPVGQFGLATLQISTEAAINATNAQGLTLDNQIAELTAQRDRVAAQLQADIFKLVMKQPVSRQQLSADTAAGQQILDSLAAYTLN